MMLDLFAAELEGRRVSASSVALASCVPQTTALRCVEEMVKGGLITRDRDPLDGRRSILQLTPAATAAMWCVMGDLDADGHCRCGGSTPPGAFVRDPSRADSTGSDRSSTQP